MEASRSIHPQEPRWRRLPGERPRQILDAALEVFGERGTHARSSFGVAQIPFGCCVEIEMVVETFVSESECEL